MRTLLLRLKTPVRIMAFIVAVVCGTAVVIGVAHWITSSWAVGTTAGVIAGVLSASLYPLLFRKH